MKKTDQIHSGSGDNIGRDKVIINLNSIVQHSQELVNILELRANAINSNLRNLYKYGNVEAFLNKFNELHANHIQALKGGQVFLAHEILIQIHKISADFEAESFWKDHEINRPNVHYSLRSDAFTRGKVICKYIVNEEEVYSERYPSFFSEFEDYRTRYNGKKEKEKSQQTQILNIYKLIMKYN